MMLIDPVYEYLGMLEQRLLLLLNYCFNDFLRFHLRSDIYESQAKDLDS
jgi:hypothetical protein